MPVRLPSPPATTRRLERSIEISCSADRLYRFHRDTRNLPKVQPDVEFLSITGQFPLEDGHEVTARFRPRYFPKVLTWHFAVEATIENELIIDVTLNSPFPYWRHEHRMERIGPMRTRLIDRVQYVPPMGILGRMAAGMIDRRLERMFEQRHQLTKALMERAPR